MSYTINLTDGTIFAVVADGTINTDSSQTLVGKNYAGYGEFLDENFVRLLENAANTSAPGAPLTGQLWYDKTNNIIKCPMVLPSKDPSVTGNVKFGVMVDGSWTDFGNFHYYKQITVNDMNPKVGPAEGEGLIYFYGQDFHDNF